MVQVAVLHPIKLVVLGLCQVANSTDNMKAKDGPDGRQIAQIGNFTLKRVFPVSTESCDPTA